jgi:arylsulfatase A-like enzyme
LEAGRFHPLGGERLEPSRATLAAVLRRSGYRTAAVVSGGFCRSAFGFGSGFEEYHDTGGRMEELSRIYFPWLERNRERRFFLYIHVGDVHDPYRAPPPYDKLWDRGYRGKQDGSRGALDALDAALERGRPPSPEDVAHLRALYDGGVSYADEHIGRLLDRLKELGLDGNTAVIVTADHGEAFLEHGLMRHGNSFYDELLRVPLIAVLPGLAGGQRLGGQARLIDLLPTVLDYLRLPAPPTQGRSLLPWLQGGPVEDREAFSETFSGAALRAGNWKLIRDRGRPEELYDLSADSGEKRSLAAESAAKKDELSARLAEWREETKRAARALPALDGVPVELDPGLREQLKAGGYLK